MNEITIKLNKTALFVVGALIVGAIAGFGGAKLTGGESVKANNNDNNPQIVDNNQPNENAPQQKLTASDVNITGADHITGAKNAKIYLVEYSDFECPYCTKFHSTMNRLLTEYGDDIAWVFRHFPLSFHPNAEPAAQASECAGEQGKFWEYSNKLFEEGALDVASLKKYARDLGLNSSQFNSCFDSEKYGYEVTSDINSAQTLGIQATPNTILVDKNGNTQIIEGAYPYETMKQIIESAL